MAVTKRDLIAAWLLEAGVDVEPWQLDVLERELPIFPTPPVRR